MSFQISIKIGCFHNLASWQSYISIKIAPSINQHNFLENKSKLSKNILKNKEGNTIFLNTRTTFIKRKLRNQIIFITVLMTPKYTNWALYSFLTFFIYHNFLKILHRYQRLLFSLKDQILLDILTSKKLQLKGQHISGKLEHFDKYSNTKYFNIQFNK